MKSYLFFLLFFILIACGSNTDVKNTKYQKLKVSELNEENMFTYIKVKSYLDEKADEKSEENRLFLLGLASFKNKKDLDSAAYYFKQSIYEKPTNMAFYELGNVLMDQKNYKKAIYAYEMAERLGYEPFSKVLYNISCAHSLLNDEELSGQYLEYAIQAGYSNIENIEKDKDLSHLRSKEYLYRLHLNNGLKGMSNVENLFWISFKRQFNKTNFPLKLDENLDILLLNDQTRISYDFERYIAEMRDVKFSREVSKGFYYLSEIVETKNYTALVYVIKEEFYGDESPLTFRIACFNKVGKLIDKKEIAGRTDFSKPLKSAIIEKDLDIVVSYFETEFEKDPEKEGYYNNKIIKKNKIKEEIYTINEKGKILLINSPSLALLK